MNRQMIQQTRHYRIVNIFHQTYNETYLLLLDTLIQLSDLSISLDPSNSVTNSNPIQAVASDDSFTVAGDDPVPVYTPLQAMTNVINNFMSNVEQPVRKKKKMIDRPYGESLTSMDALLKVNEKENQKKRRTKAKASGRKQYVTFFSIS